MSTITEFWSRTNSVISIEKSSSPNNPENNPITTPAPITIKSKNIIKNY